MQCSTRQWTGMICVAAAILTGACTGSNSGSPVAPTNSGTSLVGSSPAPTAGTGASIIGSVRTDTVSGLGVRAASTGLIVSLVGTSIEGAVESSGHFELVNVPEGDAHLQFTGPGVDAIATIDAVAAEERIEVVVTVAGPTAAVETTQRSTPTEERVTGTVAALAGTCPSLTFTLDGSSISADSSTTYGGGSNCASMKNGDKRTAVGAREGDGHLSARYLTAAEPPSAPPTPTPPTPTLPAPTPPTPTPPTPTPPAPTTVSGTIAGLAGVCPSITLTVDGTAVATNSATTYGGGGACADVRNGDRRYGAGTRQSDGRLLLTYVSGAIPTDATLTGTVSSLAGTCPALTFTVGGKTAKTTSSTTFSPGTCSDVRNGVTVTVVGAGGTDGGVPAARTVSVPRGDPQVTLNDIIGSLAGVCPSLTFTVAGTAVATNSATTFGGGGACADVRNGDRRYVVGTMQDGKLLATYISGAVSTDVTVSGTVASLAGTCPALTFTLGGKTVVTTSSTTFSPAGCGDVRNSVTLTVVGTTGTDGRVTARSVSVPRSDAEVTLSGIVAGLAGTCPSLTFTVGGGAVATNSATTYGGGSACSSVANGEIRYAIGARQSNGSVLARYISGAVTP